MVQAAVLLREVDNESAAYLFENIEISWACVSQQEIVQELPGLRVKDAEWETICAGPEVQKVDWEILR